MTIEEKALNFAIHAHNGQIRKAEPDKPKIFHPINVGNILKEYGYDENVVAAGYLHDVVEDTKYTFEDIRKEFGEDILSLVYAASEPDKSLSWEERKKHTINYIKDLDLRHKAVICADKISNLEDSYYLFGKNNKVDFSSFKRGFNDQNWYYRSIYESLINNQDKDYDMFKRYDKLIENVFCAGDIDVFLNNMIFDDDEELYKKLKILNFKNKEIKKLSSLSSNNKPYVIEFTGTPRTGKTTLIKNLEDFFKKGGFNVTVLEEFTTSKRYKTEIYPAIKDKDKSVINTLIPEFVQKDLEKSILDNHDIILIDRSLYDRLIWADRLYQKNGFTREEYENYKKKYVPIIRKYIDIVIGTYAYSITSLKRDYKNSLSLEKRRFLNKDNIDEYNTSFYNIESLSKLTGINFHKVDTTNRSAQDVSLETADIILNDARNTYIKRLKKEFNFKE